MIDPSATLRLLRKAAGYPSARAAARALDVPVATYVQHENGKREISIRQFHRYRIFLQAAQLIARFQKAAAVPDPEILAALVYDAAHTAKRWTQASSATMDAYRKGVEAALQAKGITLPAESPSPVLDASEGSQP